jgi:ribose transport system substrate-binding protein
MKKVLMTMAVAGLAVSVDAANAAEKKTLAVVVKGLDNPFFTLVDNGCKKWNADHADSEYECLYTGPVLTSDEAGEVELVAGLIAKGVAGIAISPSNAPAMAAMLKEKNPAMPVMTIDVDLEKADHGLRKTYLGTKNYDMGVKMAQHLMRLNPKGGTVCLQLGSVAADNANERAAGFRDTIAGKEGTERLTGQGGWTEIDGCPLYTNGEIATANQQMADVTGANKDLSAFIMVLGWAEFGPEAYAANCKQLKDRLDSKKLIVIAGDTLPPEMDALKAGCSHAQIGQRPFEMGNRAPDVLMDLIAGKNVEDPLYTGLDECTAETADTCLPK